MPTHAAAIAPVMSWPAPPMLNSPARKARATESPTRISGVDWTSVRAMADWLPSDESNRAR